MTTSKTQTSARQLGAHRPAAGSGAHQRDADSSSTAQVNAPAVPAMALDDRPAQEHRSPSGSDQAALLQARTAEAAYYKALARGFAPGRELDDWLAAERELDAPVQTTSD